jgi:hypothetical protein
VDGGDAGHSGDGDEIHDGGSGHGRTPLERHQSPTSGGTVTPLSKASIHSRSPPSENLDADHDDDVPLWYRKLGDILGPGSPPGQGP